MTIEQCDHCQKIIDLKDKVKIRLGLAFIGVELCMACAQPIIEILKKYELSDNSWQKSLPNVKEAV